VADHKMALTDTDRDGRPCDWTCAYCGEHRSRCQGTRPTQAEVFASHFAACRRSDRAIAARLGIRAALFKKFERGIQHAGPGLAWEVSSAGSMRGAYLALREAGLVEGDGSEVMMFGRRIASATLTPKGRMAVWLLAEQAPAWLESWRRACREWRAYNDLGPTP